MNTVNQSGNYGRNFGIFITILVFYVLYLLG